MSIRALLTNVKQWFRDSRNVSAVLIVVSGLLVGSLFVDLGQLLSGSGFSSRAIRSHDVLVTGGKTWVAYTEPKVRLRIVHDAQCEACDPSEALLWLRRIVPTIETELIDVATTEGKQLIDAFHIVTVPTFIFDGAVKQTEFYTQAESLFREAQHALIFDMHMIGMPIGRYLVTPEVGAGAISVGASDAPVTMMVFSDFQCQYCRELHATVKRLLAAYEGRLRIVWKHLPLASHPQATAAAEAAQCAARFDQFMSYADILFERQNEWGKVGAERRFKEYAWRVRGLDGAAFARCLDGKLTAENVAADIQLAADFHIESTPTIFIGQEFISGAAPYEDLQVLIESALAK